jgi:hypothetical protein
MTGSTIKGQIQREDLALFDGNTMTATRPNSSGGVQTGNRVGDAVDVKLIHGGSSNSASFQKAVDAMGTQNGSLLFTPETWNITANITVPSNVTLIVPAGCVFNIDSGITITNNGVLFRYHKTFSSGSGTFTQSGTDILQIAGQSDIYGLDTGSTNTYVITTQASFSALATGLAVRFEPTSTNTGACTLNVDNLGAKTLKPVGSSQDMPAGSIVSGGIYTAVYDATSDIFQVSDYVGAASASDLVIDAEGDIILDANGADISFKDAGTEFGKISNSSTDLIISSIVADKDIKFNGLDSSSAITALTLDMSEAGKGIFSGDLEVGDDLSLASDSAVFSMGTDSEITITHNHNTGITLNDKDISGVASLNTTSTGTRNYIINGSFDVAQRGQTINATTPFSNANNTENYCLDNFIIVSDGNDAIDVSQSTTAPTGSTHSAQLSIETANKKAGLLQWLEASQCQNLIGKTVTLSFQAKSDDAAIDDFRAVVLSWSGDKDLVDKTIISSFGSEGSNPTYNTNVTAENTSANLNLSTSFQKFSISCDIDTSNAKNVGVYIFSNTTTGLSAGENIFISQVQLEVGSTATEYVHEDVSTTFLKCARYFRGWLETSDDSASTSAIATGHNVAGTSARLQLFNPVPFRATPTIDENETFAVSHTAGNVTGIASIGTVGGQQPGLTFNITYGSTAFTAGAQIAFLLDTTESGTSRCFISCELGV